MQLDLSGPLLVVEDEVLVRLDLVEALEVAGFSVKEARNADEAIDILAGDQSVCAVFTDIKMPGSMDGIDLAHVVHERWPSILIVVSSANINSDNRAKPPGTLLMHKPYDIRDLKAILDKLVSDPLG